MTYENTRIIAQSIASTANTTAMQKIATRILSVIGIRSTPFSENNN
jgi:hypothetical protein